MDCASLGSCYGKFACCSMSLSAWCRCECSNQRRKICYGFSVSEKSFGCQRLS
eukprot:Awhi_evm1s7209